MSLLTSKLLEVSPTINLNLNSSLPTAFTSSRASQGTQVQNGVLSYAPNNLLLYSATNNAVWLATGSPASPTITMNNAVAPDGTTTATREVLPSTFAGGSFGNFAQSVTIPAGVFTFSVWLRGAAGGEVVYPCATPDGVNYIRTTASLTTAWQRFSTTGTLTAALWYFSVGVDRRDASQAGQPAQTVFVWGAQLELNSTMGTYNPTTNAAYYGPRFETSPAGWLGEPQGTNNILQSATSSGWSVAFNGTNTQVQTVNFTTSPSGATDATKIVQSSVAAINTYALFYQAFTFSATQINISVWLKGAVGGELVYLQASIGGYFRTLATLTTSWARYNVPLLPTAGAGYVQIGTDLRDGSQSATPAQTYFVWGVQEEAGAFTTSLIQTTTTAATRAADNLTLDLTQLPGLQTAGGYGVAMDFSVISNTQNSSIVLSASINGDSTNRWYIVMDAAGQLAVVSNVSGVGQATAYLPMRTAGLTNRLALSVTPAGIRWTMNGAAVVGLTNAGQPLMGTLAVGRIANNTNFYTAMHATLVTLTPGPQSDAALIARAY